MNANDRGSLRILYVADGASPHTQRMLRYFVGAGHEIHLVTGRPVYLEGVRIHCPPVPYGPLRFRDWAAFVQDTIAEVAPDIVHGHYASIHGLWAALSGFHPFVLSVWGSDIFVDPHLEPQYGKLIRFGLAQADRILGNSNLLLETAGQLAGFPLAPTQLVRFGVDFDTFVPGDTEELRAAHGLDDGPVIFSPRQFRKGANIDRIVEAMPAVLARHPRATLVLLSLGTPKDDYYESLMGLLEELDLEPHVRVLAGVPHDQMPTWYALADVVLSIRDSDAGSETVTESLGVGTPVVVSDIPTNRELVPDGCGLFVDPHDVAAVSAAICAVLDGGPEIAAMVDRGRARARELGDRRLHMERAAEVYREVMGPDPALLQGATAHLGPSWRSASALLADELRWHLTGDAGASAGEDRLGTVFATVFGTEATSAPVNRG